MKIKTYVHLDSYSMKCRLDTNEKQYVQLNSLSHGAAAVYNMILYEFKNYKYCKEVKGETGEVVHFPDFGLASKSINMKELRHQNECVNYLPGYSLSGTNGIINDIKKGWEKTGKHPIEQWDWVKKKDGIEQHFGPQSKSKYTRDISFCYQTSWVNINIVKEKNDAIKKGIDISKTERKNLGIKIKSENYSVDGYIKIKGWNEKLRFDENLTMDFYDYLLSDEIEKPKMVRIRVKKEHGEYFIIFTLTNVWREAIIEDNRVDGPGLDLGEITLATSSYDDDIKSIYDHNPRYQATLDKIDFYNEKLSKQWGYKNPKFREARKKDRHISPSNQYKRTEKKYQHYLRRRNDMKETYYHQESAKKIAQYSTIYMETLNIKDMYWYKEKQKDAKKAEQNEKTNCETQSKSE